MKDIHVLSIQDISCFGQCSLTVALPVLSSLGIETAILPTAILSTHTSGFKGYTFRDLKEDLPAIIAHWKKECLRFDAVYTGYLGHEKDVEAVLEIAHSELNRGPLIVDPAFGDDGELYGGFDSHYVEGMRDLVKEADILLPNLTEACALLGIPYNPNPNEAETEAILQGLYALGAKSIVLKGIDKTEDRIGLAIYDGKSIQRYSHARLSRDSHGTGDVFASVFVGGLMRGLDLFGAGKLAADFTYRCIENTQDDATHTYGVKFEPLLYGLETTLRTALER